MAAASSSRCCFFFSEGSPSWGGGSWAGAERGTATPASAAARRTIRSLMSVLRGSEKRESLSISTQEGGRVRGKSPRPCLYFHTTMQGASGHGSSNKWPRFAGTGVSYETLVETLMMRFAARWLLLLLLGGSALAQESRNSS